jgi:FlaA1/EpsC-like NDP-sugar epimerase
MRLSSGLRRPKVDRDIEKDRLKMTRFDEIYRHPWTIRYVKRPIKRYLFPALGDGMLVVVAYFAALSVRFIGQVPDRFMGQLNPWLILVALVYVGANLKWHIYGRLWRRATARDVVALLEAVGFATLLVIASDLLHGSRRPLPVSQIVLGGFFTVFLMLALRCRHLLVARGWTVWRAGPQSRSNRVRVLIVGAGDHGQRLARHLRDDPVQMTHYEAVGFVDDDYTKVGLRIDGLAVLGTRRGIPGLVTQHAIDQIIISSRAAFGDTFDDLVTACQETPAQIKVLSRFCDLLDNGNRLPNLRNLTIEDLLEREPVSIDRHTCLQTLAAQTILVTGAGGSIGSELCRQLVHFNPSSLLLVDNNETGLYDLYRELQEVEGEGSPVRVVPLVADITDFHKMKNIFGSYSPQIVFHAAAYKHVPVMEDHPEEAIRVNVMGTATLSELADGFGVERFVLISTDKAVNPSSVMGASKRMAELWIAALQGDSETRFAAVRFGNVLGSRGSVIPLFNRQIERGGPVTVTDPRMTRYFMSIPEAASLIIQAGTFAKGGEIYMLDMGQPIHIVDLAQKMIRLKGLRIGRDVQIKFIGIRPGEKLREELAYDAEHKQSTAHPKIYSLENHRSPDKESLQQLIAVFVAASQSSPEMISRLRRAIILAALGQVDSSLDVLTDMTLSSGSQRWANRRRAISENMVLQQQFFPEGAARPLHPLVAGGSD